MERNLDFCCNSFGNLEHKIDSLLFKLKNIKENPELIDALFIGKVENLLRVLHERINVCSHCGGMTDESGNCLEHFTE